MVSYKALNTIFESTEMIIKVYPGIKINPRMIQKERKIEWQIPFQVWH